MKKTLKNVFKNVTILKKIGFISNKFIVGIYIHSNNVKKNSMFFAKKGEITDGHEFINEAIKRGANTIVCEKIPICINKNITYILVKNTIVSLGIISSNFYDNPTKKIKLIGITGTNGKTSIATILHQLFYKMGEDNILISTIEIRILSNKYKTIHTTPNIIDINKYLYLGIKKKCKYAFIEVSSHGIDQKRIYGLLFKGGVFTNITHDHLDYHKSFHHYLFTKKFFFNSLPNKSFALINCDDKHYDKIIKEISAKLYSYGLKKNADFNAKILQTNFYGSSILINGHKIFTSLIGKFNVYNILASYATSILLGKKKDEILKIINEIKPVNGRFEQFLSNSGIRVIVDYAHNPNGLKTIIKSIKEIKKKNVRLICVIGCGGNRDVIKRSLMGKIVYEECDISIFTSDNPREEDPYKIFMDMKNFSSYIEKKPILTILSRKKAIKTAIKIANKNKKYIILIAGKGHENYQEIKGSRYPFNDIKIIKNFLNKK
ncbi:UDP-N-acetylmuramoyl-L-alanyl-D-glutamate--2,6-diaminopimelate ligase [Blattabacterium cuenoti]|uniref:UDP-N-acetylmuramoyl-L-alanyl-D-glutamate--2, 6-diaminopimelate ligase n=1 Tax=Blattabacterium cuenoti TaxID=1653831 RepID=UPI00163D22A3|nr:UDP-N-acetylmuramoyl-L-alanyl-D-glutamate--2,6-diaminopimelate ligase [Blattabacterium cuenoti]